jgi:hypothetical protein
MSFVPSSLMGLFGCVCTIFVTFLPPPDIDIGNPVMYFLLIGLGNILAISPVFLFFQCKKTTDYNALNKVVRS